MKKCISMIIIILLIILVGTGCSKNGGLGDSKSRQNNPKVVEPNTAYPFTKGLHRQKLSMTLDKAVSFYKESYPDISEFTHSNLNISDDRYIWEITGTDGQSIYILEFDAVTKEILWEGTVDQTPEQQEALKLRTFSPKNAIAYTKAISVAEGAVEGSVNSVQLEKLGDTLTYTIYFESETSRNNAYVDAKTGTLIE